MQNFEARLVFGATRVINRDGCTVYSFSGMGSTRHLEAIDKVNAFEQLYNQAKTETDGEITVLKTDYQKLALGLTDEEYKRIEAITGGNLKEGFPTGAGIQIEFIREIPT